MQEEKEDFGRLDNRMVILASSRFKHEYSKMCEALGQNPSERIREGMEKDLLAYKAKQAAK